jgi:predicted MPP superfamily phosphohydrolase
MNRLVNPFVLTVTAMLVAGYLYVAARLAGSTAAGLALAVPFIMAWVVPVVYWGSDRDRYGLFNQLVHYASYLSMGWLSFLVILTAARDALLLLTSAIGAQLDAPVPVIDVGIPLVYAGSVAALGAGLIAAFRGPCVERVEIPIKGLSRELDGFRIVQISDLHVGLTIRGRYVQRVVEQAKALAPDLIALTGDIVDGPVARLADHVQALEELPAIAPSFLVLGNHEYYSGAMNWIRHFQAIGLPVLMNSSAIVTKGAARVLVGGVTDPAAHLYDRGRPPRPDLAAGKESADFRLLLAHNPKLAPAGAKAGFDLQLSGHTHAGQFFPWTLAVRLVHAPHAAGLSREGTMWVYVSAGTGTWGPPVRFGTKPELTLLRLVRADDA